MLTTFMKAFRLFILLNTRQQKPLCVLTSLREEEVPLLFMPVPL